MINTFFIADTHFRHNKILEYEKENRPFSSIEEHDEELIKRWNEVVKPNDNIYHLGDFALGGGASVINIGRRLNGKKRLIMGNHDTYLLEYYQCVFERIFGVLPYKKMILSHVPLHPQHTRFELNVHGHLHSKTVQGSTIWYDENGRMNTPDIHYFCVSAEQNNLTPIHLDILKQRLKELE